MRVHRAQLELNAYYYYCTSRRSQNLLLQSSAEKGITMKITTTSFTICIRRTRRLEVRTPLSWHCNNRRQIQFVSPRGQTPNLPDHQTLCNLQDRPRFFPASTHSCTTPAAPHENHHHHHVITTQNSANCCSHGLIPPAFRNAIPLREVLRELGIRRLHEFPVTLG